MIGKPTGVSKWLGFAVHCVGLVKLGIGLDSGLDGVGYDDGLRSTGACRTGRISGWGLQRWGGILENVDEAAAECQDDLKCLRFKRLGYRRLDQPLNLSLYPRHPDWTEQ